MGLPTGSNPNAGAHSAFLFRVSSEFSELCNIEANLTILASRRKHGRGGQTGSAGRPAQATEESRRGLGRGVYSSPRAGAAGVGPRSGPVAATRTGPGSLPAAPAVVEELAVVEERRRRRYVRVSPSRSGSGRAAGPGRWSTHRAEGDSDERPETPAEPESTRMTVGSDVHRPVYTAFLPPSLAATTCARCRTAPAGRRRDGGRSSGGAAAAAAAAAAAGRSWEMQFRLRSCVTCVCCLDPRLWSSGSYSVVGLRGFRFAWVKVISHRPLKVDGATRWCSG